MRAFMIAAAFMLVVAACGKKAPLRAPDEPETTSQLN